LLIRLGFVLHPLSRTRFFITNANPACSCVYICKFQLRPIHPPLGDYQLRRVLPALDEAIDSGSEWTLRAYSFK
jgi:hypothetical protein